MKNIIFSKEFVDQLFQDNQYLQPLKSLMAHWLNDASNIHHCALIIVALDRFPKKTTTAKNAIFDEIKKILPDIKLITNYIEENKTTSWEYLYAYYNHNIIGYIGKMFYKNNISNEDFIKPIITNCLEKVDSNIKRLTEHNEHSCSLIHASLKYNYSTAVNTIAALSGEKIHQLLMKCESDTSTLNNNVFEKLVSYYESKRDQHRDTWTLRLEITSSWWWDQTLRSDNISPDNKIRMIQLSLHNIDAKKLTWYLFHHYNNQDTLQVIFDQVSKKPQNNTSLMQDLTNILTSHQAIIDKESLLASLSQGKSTVFEVLLTNNEPAIKSMQAIYQVADPTDQRYQSLLIGFLAFTIRDYRPVASQGAYKLFALCDVKPSCLYNISSGELHPTIVSAIEHRAHNNRDDTNIIHRTLLHTQVTALMAYFSSHGQRNYGFFHSRYIGKAADFTHRINALLGDEHYAPQTFHSFFSHRYENYCVGMPRIALSDSEKTALRKLMTELVDQHKDQLPDACFQELKGKFVTANAPPLPEATIISAEQQENYRLTMAKVI